MDAGEKESEKMNESANGRKETGKVGGIKVRGEKERKARRRVGLSRL